MVRRSVLFTPGDRPDTCRKAPDSGADVIVFDLGDAVAPQRTAEAREAVREVPIGSDFEPDAEVCVRVNAAEETRSDDLAADVGATRTAEGTEVLYARERVVLAAANDCAAIDTIELGYDGKLAIHPAQVGPINEAFTPSAEEREWAECVLAGKHEADAEERGVFAVDGETIDAPLTARAERIPDRAETADNG